MAKKTVVDLPPVEAYAAPVAERLELTPEEIQAVLEARKKINEPVTQSGAVSELAQALVTAINLTKPKEKTKAYNRKKICKQCGRDHKENIKLKRTWFQHGSFEINPLLQCNSTIELLNKVKPGFYISNLVQVRKRRDRSYDITWPVRTNAQRLRVMDEAARRTGMGQTFDAILTACIIEASDPRRFKGPEDDED